MRLFYVGEKIVGLLMIIGSCTLLLMLSDLLYRLYVYVSEFISARIHNREPIAGLKATLLYSGLSTSDLNGLNGIMMPMIIGCLAAGFMVYTFGFQNSAMPILVVIFWCITWACLSNIHYHRSFCLHSILLVRKFFGSYAATRLCEDAMVHICAELPAGSIRHCAKECIKLSTKNLPWEKAVRVFDNGSFCGQVLASYLNSFENSMVIITDEITASYVKELSDKAESLTVNSMKLSAFNIALLVSGIAFTALSAWFVYNGIGEGIRIAALYCYGISLCAARVLHRNAAVDGRLA
ncbi:MAG: hypothetical protein IJI14_08235 [Anaerolineaceae bacterium]|nr:hypothetical protein [Anaerolineaceae bacterium]